jgi:hypothetical protein
MELQFMNPDTPGRDSIVKLNALKDPLYCPYCLRCRGLVRMILVEPSCGGATVEQSTTNEVEVKEPPYTYHCQGTWILERGGQVVWEAVTVRDLLQWAKANGIKPEWRPVRFIRLR